MYVLYNNMYVCINMYVQYCFTVTTSGNAAHWASRADKNDSTRSL